MALSPHPQNDAMVGGRDGRASFAWSQWFNALRAAFTGHTTRLEALEARVTALEARVTALEGS